MTRSSGARALVSLGALGTAVMVATSWWAGAVPARFRTQHDSTPVIRWLPVGGALPITLAVVGLVLVLLAWLGVGRLVHEGRPAPVRAALLWWTLPWLVALPWGTRDPWAYAAQGDIAFRGLDPFHASPATVGGPFSADVSSRWIDAPAPYGPLWLEFSRLVRAVCGTHGIVTVLVYRVPVVAAVFAIAWLIRRVAARVDMSPDVASWLAVLNPVTIVLGVGGAHNDLVMVALMLAGVAAVTRVSDTWWTPLALAGAWCALGAAVKAPAAVAVAFAVPIWWHYGGAGGARTTSPRVRRGMVACLVTGGAFVVVFGAITAVSGWGLGWAGQIGPDARIVNWTSIPTAVVLVYRVVTGDPHTRAVTPVLERLRTVGTAVTVVALVPMWLRAYVRDPLLWAGAFFLVVIFLGAAVQPWYLCWALPFLGLTRLPRWALVALAGVSAGWTPIIEPSGDSAIMKPVAALYLALGLGLAWLAVGRVHGRRLITTPSTPGPV